MSEVVNMYTETFLGTTDDLNARFKDVKVTLEPNPTRDVLINYSMTVISSSKRFLLPIPGFRSRFFTLESFPFPFSVSADSIEMQVVKAVAKDKHDGHLCPVKVSSFRLKNGNYGLLIKLPGEGPYQVSVTCQLLGFARADALSTELIIGVEPPQPWKAGDLQVAVQGGLQTATWGRKEVAGVHCLRTGKRRRFEEKFRPSDNARRLFLTGNDLKWSFLVKTLEPDHEVRIRLRASRVPLLAPASPIVMTLTALSLVLLGIARFIISLVE